MRGKKYKASLIHSKGPNPAPLRTTLAVHCRDLRPAGHGLVMLQLDERMVVGPFQMNYVTSLSSNINVCIYVNIRTCSVIPSGQIITPVERKQIYEWVCVAELSARALRRWGAAG